MKQSSILFWLLAMTASPVHAKQTGDSTAGFTISIQNVISLHPYILYGNSAESATQFEIVSDTDIVCLTQQNSALFPLRFFAKKDNLCTDTILLQTTSNIDLQFTGITGGKLKYISAESMHRATADSVLQAMDEQNQGTGNMAWHRRNEIFISLGLVLAAAFLLWKLYKRKKRTNNLPDEV